MEELSDPRLGKTFEGRYHIDSLIADGGMATVYRATDTRLERPVALKLIHQQLASGPHRNQFLHRFHLEATSAAHVADSHIVQVYDTGTWNGLPFLVMEYVNGTDLRHKLSAEKTLTVRESLRILIQVLEGLSAAHEAGIVHRDIKPENILLTPRGHIKITDFGLAKALGHNTTGTTGLLLGTASYLAPETIQNDVSTAASDIYAVGIVAFEMLTGSVPFASSNAVTTVFKHVNENIPDLSTIDPAFAGPLSRAIASLCARDPRQRPQDGEHALALLHRLVQELPPELLDYRHPPVSPATEIPAPLHSARPVVHRHRISRGTAALPDPTRPIAHVAAPTQRMASSIRSVSRPGRSKKAFAILLTVFALLAAAALGVWWWLFGPGSTYTVPKAADLHCTSAPCSLRGASWQNYQKQLKRDSIPYTTQHRFSDTVASGHIISSSRDGGQKLSRRLGPLQVVVSKGEKQVTIPANLLDCSQYPHAKAYLASLGMKKISVHNHWSLDAPKGCVVSSSIPPGMRVGHMKEIVLVVSKGPKPVTVPFVQGQTADKALKSLSALKLAIVRKQAFSDTVPAGQVIEINPSSGSPLHWGDRVTLTISQGPQTVIMPNLIGASKKDAQERLEKLGFAVRTQSSPIGELLHQVFSQSVRPGTRVRLRDTNGKPTVVTLTCV